VASTEEDVMTQGPRRLRGLSVLGLGLVIGLLAAACSGAAATPSPAASTAGDGTGLDGVWLLTDYVSVDGTNFTVPSAVTPNIRFDGDAASGQAGCNTFNAVAIINGNELRFDTVQSTKMACEDPMATVEAAFLQALSLSTTYTVTGDQLVITNPEGKPALTFVRGT
jgi:heat shock protein HslJ